MFIKILLWEGWGVDHDYFNSIGVGLLMTFDDKGRRGAKKKAYNLMR